MAHKKGKGSTSNGRDSKAQYRGVKRYGGEFVTAGTILVRQVGNLFHAGKDVGTGKDYTLFASKDGIVKFHRKNKKTKLISIIPVVNHNSLNSQVG